MARFYLAGQSGPEALHWARARLLCAAIINATDPVVTTPALAALCRNARRAASSTSLRLASGFRFVVMDSTYFALQLWHGYGVQPARARLFPAAIISATDPVVTTPAFAALCRKARRAVSSTLLAFAFGFSLIEISPSSPLGRFRFTIIIIRRGGPHPVFNFFERIIASGALPGDHRPVRRRISNPPGSWGMKISVPYPMGLEQEGFIALRGQCDLSPEGDVLNAGDLTAQTRAIVGHARAVFDDLNVSFPGRSRLALYYQADTAAPDESDYLIRQAVGPAPQTSLVTIPVPVFYYPGLVAELDAFGIANEGPDFVFVPPQRGTGTSFEEQVRAAYSALHDWLGKRNLASRNLLKVFTRYAGGPGDFPALIRARDDFLADTNAVFADLPLPSPGEDTLVEIDAIAVGDVVPQPADKRSLAVRAGPLIVTSAIAALDDDGAVLRPGDLVAQTRIVMERIEGLLSDVDLTFADVVKVNTHYVGSASADDLHRNMEIRNACFPDPGPGSTGIPVPVLPRPGQMTAVEIMALAPKTTAANLKGSNRLPEKAAD